jgi:hypothetical protein
VGQRKQALWKIFVEPSHHVGHAALGVPAQEIGLKRVVTIRALVCPDPAGEVVAAEVQHGVLQLPILTGDLRVDPDVADPEPTALVGLADLVKPAHPPGVDSALVRILLDEPADRVVGDDTA